MSLEVTTTAEELRARFLALSSRRDIATLLEIEYSQLAYHLYKTPSSAKYTTFNIKKKSGGMREISAPISPLKIIQRKLNTVLQNVYSPRPCVNGFVYNKNIVDNARAHRKKKLVLNLDLQDFFPSINFGRVRGMFLRPPYNFNQEVATTLAQICCFNNQLPQGAPTSPVVSNMICSKMDGHLIHLANISRCTYTRYADDLTFSTTLPEFPPTIATLEYEGEVRRVQIGDTLYRIIKENWFAINPAKVRIQTTFARQEVTGLVVNKFPNVQRKFVRQIRAMLYAWKEHGLPNAEREFHTKYMPHRNPKRGIPSFKNIVKGKIEFLRMVKGYDDFVYINLCKRLKLLAPGLVPAREVEEDVAYIKKCLWVLEDLTRSIQGTGFMLEGYGLVTCTHVVWSSTHAFQPDSGTRYPVQVIAWNDEIDLAILKIPAETRYHLTKGEPDTLKDGDKITWHGFPNYNLGDEGEFYSGHIAGRRFVNPIRKGEPTIRRILFNGPIISGGSGGPVLDKDNKVIGVVASGEESILKARETEKNTIIPINSLNYLMGS